MALSRYGGNALHRSSTQLRRQALAAHLFTLGCLLAWWLAAWVTPDYVLPGPVAVVRKMIALCTEPRLLRHGMVSVMHVLSAIGIVLPIGAAMAFLAHRVPEAALLVHGRIRPFFSAFSSVGWTFLAVIWFGVSHMTVIFAVFAVLLPFVIINLREGMSRLDGEILEMARSFGRGRLRILLSIVLPLLVPYLLGALRICFGVGWVIVPTVELFGSNAGYGYLINLATTDFDNDMLFAVLLIIVSVVYLVDRFVFSPVQRRVQRTHGAMAEGEPHG